MSSNELNNILENSLINYILIINVEKTFDELKGCGLHWLVNEYCETYAIPVECFYSCLANIVKQYKEDNPEDDFSDEEIYAMTDAFDPVNFFNESSLYYEDRAKSLIQLLEEVNNRFFECLQDVQLEEERLKTARTSYEISEIRSDIAQANIALERARSKESNLLKEEHANNLAKSKLHKIIERYNDIKNAKDEDSEFILSRKNSKKPE